MKKTNNTTPLNDKVKDVPTVNEDELGMEITSLHPHVKEVPRAVRVSRYMAPKTNDQQKK